MSDPIEAFFATWSMADADARLAALSGITAAATTYADPRTSEPLTGPQAIAEYVGMFAQSAPGATAKVIKSDQQNGMTRVTIAFEMADGMIQHGQYYIEMDGALITRMTGFVGTGAPE